VNLESIQWKPYLVIAGNNSSELKLKGCVFLCPSLLKNKVSYKSSLPSAL